MAWQLIEATDVECTMDDSGVYVVIHRQVEGMVHKGYSGQIVRVRADLIGTTGMGTSEPNWPVVSFIGKANNVRKRLIAYIRTNFCADQLSMEHASYIGWELHRAETDPNYVQD